jgi:trans-L-3-hydroxyproline dehydratase
VLKAGLPIQVGKRPMVADVAFGGAFYAIVDTEAAGVALRSDCLPELRRLAGEIKAAVQRALPVVHPLEPGLNGIYGTIFTGVANAPGADLRNVTVFADGQVDRSPCGTGTAAVMAVLDAMGLLAADRPFVHESLISTLFTGRIVERTSVSDLAAIVPELEGSAWITGEHTFLIDDEDPLRDGFAI